MPFERKREHKRTQNQNREIKIAKGETEGKPHGEKMQKGKAGKGHQQHHLLQPMRGKMEQ